MSEQMEKFDQWGIVEVMGHRRYAGHITEQVIGGSALIRIDVPAVEVPKRYESDSSAKSVAAYTKLVGVGSIYCITPTTEDIARAAAVEIARYDGEVLPVQLPVSRQIAAASTVEVPDDDDEYDDEGWDGYQPAAEASR